MDLRGFLEKLPGQYLDWGSPFMSPDSTRFNAFFSLPDYDRDKFLFPLLDRAVAHLEDNEIYCQIGCFRRGSLVSALIGNNDRLAHAVEFFSRYDPTGQNLEQLSADLEAFQLQDNIFLNDTDTIAFFRNLREIGSDDKIGVLYYDASPEYRELFLSLLLAREFLSDSGLIIVHKCDLDSVRQALDDFLTLEPRAGVLLDRKVANHGILGFKDLCILTWNAPPDFKPLESPKKRVLNVGCGPYNPNALPPLFKDGTWQEIRLDIDPKVNPDILGTITDLSAVPDNSIHAIFSSHNLEHIYQYEVPAALGEFKRVLKPDGFILLVIPDMQTAAEWVARGDMDDEPLYISPGGPVKALWMFYGMGTSYPGIPYMAHKTGFTAPSLTFCLKEAGFAKVEVKRAEFELIAFAYK